jgi:AP-3 complex subunit delta-1
VQNALKLFAYIASSENQQDLMELARQLEAHLAEFVVSADLEVQERASTGLQLLKYVIRLGEGAEEFSSSALSVFFAGELNPVGPKAQKKVPLPEGLDLDAWINEPPPETESSSSDEEDVAAHAFVRSPSDITRSSDKSKNHHEPTEEELRMSREQRMLQQSLNPNYLKDPKSSSNASSSLSSPRSKSLVGMEDIPMQQVDVSALPLFIPGLASTDQYLNMSRNSSDEEAIDGGKKKRTKKKKRRKESVEAEEPPVSAVVMKRLEMPEGAAESDDDADANRLPADDPHRALSDINLEDLVYRAPYRASEAETGMGVADGGSAHVPRNLFGLREEDKSAKKRKKKKEKEKEAEEISRKDSEKKKKKKKDKDKEKESGDKKEKKHKKHKSEKVEADGIDLWLDGGHA